MLNSQLKKKRSGDAAEVSVQYQFYLIHASSSDLRLRKIHDTTSNPIIDL